MGSIAVQRRYAGDGGICAITKVQSRYGEARATSAGAPVRTADAVPITPFRYTGTKALQLSGIEFPAFTSPGRNTACDRYQTCRDPASCFLGRTGEQGRHLIESHKAALPCPE